MELLDALITAGMRPILTLVEGLFALLLVLP